MLYVGAVARPALHRSDVEVFQDLYVYIHGCTNLPEAIPPEPFEAYWVLLSLTESYWVLLSLIEFG